MIANLMWIVTIFAIIGTILNIKKKPICFVIWLCTNTLWCVYDFSIKSYAQSALFLVYVVLAIWGIYEWRNKERE
jgi:nicotinamide riboside transporter PnuC